MSIAFRVDTNRKPIVVDYHLIRRHPRIDCDVAVLHLSIGGATVEICFEDGDEMIAFCEAHNFPYEDRREVAA